LPAVRTDFCPGDLEACDSLGGVDPGHTPQEVTSDVALVDGEGRCQVLWLRQHLGWTRDSLPWTRYVFVGLALESGTGRRDKGGALVLGPSFGL